MTERADLVAELRAAIEALPRQTVHADPFFPETYDYETVGLDAVLERLAALGAESLPGGWEAAMGDPAFVSALDEGLADVAAAA